MGHIECFMLLCCCDKCKYDPDCETHLQDRIEMELNKVFDVYSGSEDIPRIDNEDEEIT